MEPLTIEDVARTSDDLAVRRRFDAQNLGYTTILLVFFAFVPLLFLVESDHRRTTQQFVAAFVNIAVVAVLLLVVRDIYRVRAAKTVKHGSPAHFLQHHISATVLSYMAVQYVLCHMYTRGTDWVAWAIVFPLMMIGLRLMVAEHILLHALLAVSGPVLWYFRPTRSYIAQFVGIGLINAGALAFELLMSRRLKREVVRDWGERRAQAREQIRMRDELRNARELQLSMLPEAPPQVGWLDLSGLSLPASEVGGDYYDYFVTDARVAVVCGDVAGHGLSSGLVLATLRAGFTLLRDSLHDPAAVLKQLHDLVAQTSRRRTLVTVAVVLLDRESRRVTIASAGHPPVLVRRGDSVRVIELYAPPLGVRLPVDIPSVQFDLQPGDTFVLHSDGIYESVNAAGDSYGLERLTELVRSRPPGESAESLRNAIAHDVETFRHRQDDDVTIVVAVVA